MKTPIYPCLWFDGNAEAAAALYSKAFKKTVVQLCTPLVVTFSIKGRLFMGLNGGSNFKPNASISFFNLCTSEAEIKQAWAVLSDGGMILMPLETYPWSRKYGWVQDRFGVSWQLMLTDEHNKNSEVFPSLMFAGVQNGQARAAIDFYTSLFNNSAVTLVSEYTAEDNDKPGNIKHAQFLLDNGRFGAMESSMQHNFQFDEGVSLVVSCETQEEIDFYWMNLSKGGIEGRCGWCRDAFGVWWQVVPSILGELMSRPDKAPKVMEAFLKMNKFDIEVLLRAAA
jgi:predicted 3-demethylubiquinone-9 3-methyltransferase (glyoxalase superfamily)